MTEEQFSAAELYESWVNIRNDIPAQTIQNTGQFKEIIAGDPIKAEEKYQDPFMFSPDTKHMFSGNELPEAEESDNSDAFYRRIMLVAFPETIPRSERESDLDQQLQSELPGVLNWALEGLKRLRDSDGFTGDRPPGQTEITWQKWSNSIKRFVEEGLEEAGGNDIAKSEVQGHIKTTVSLRGFLLDHNINSLAGLTRTPHLRMDVHISVGHPVSIESECSSTANLPRLDASIWNATIQRNQFPFSLFLLHKNESCNK
ncbi:putative DNA-polymerase or DNA-primase [environmental Halophage eHP-41]|nr:putative DNA-polymerase or DNA-primase [environmental Halophage eHP-41]